MLRKVKDFFELEYTSTVRYLNSSYVKGNERMVVEKSISRCLGVAQFVQGIGVTYEEVDPVYNHYKKLFELLLDRQPKKWYNNYRKRGNENGCIT